MKEKSRWLLAFSVALPLLPVMQARAEQPMIQFPSTTQAPGSAAAPVRDTAEPPAKPAATERRAVANPASMREAASPAPPVKQAAEAPPVQVPSGQAAPVQEPPAPVAEPARQPVAAAPTLPQTPQQKAALDAASTWDRAGRGKTAAGTPPAAPEPARIFPTVKDVWPAPPAAAPDPRPRVGAVLAPPPEPPTEPRSGGGGPPPGFPSYPAAGESGFLDFGR